MKKKNFHIVRYYINDNCEFAVQVTKKQSQQFENYFQFTYENQTGGYTTYYRVDVQP